MSEQGISNARVENLDEDEDKTRGAGRPNAWWADQRRREAAENAEREGQDNFTGSVRGTPSAPRGGSQTVTEADVHGAIDLCWCGEPLDHDWPGKDRGRRHPRKATKKVTTSSSETRTRIDRRSLRAYHEDLQEVILEAVNSYGARYRLRKNGVMLYPPDGTEPYQIHARNTDRQVRAARLWFVRHCVQVSPTRDPKTDEPKMVSTNPIVRDPEVLLDDADQRHAARRLAEALNSPEHPVPPEQPELQYQDTPAEPAEYLPAQEESPVDRTDEEQPWIPFVAKDGRGTSKFAEDLFETQQQADGTTRYRCRACLGTDHEYITDTSRGIGGHIRTRHGDAAETMWSPQARAKAFDTMRYNKLSQQVGAAIELLQDVIGVTPQDQTAEVEALTARVAELEAENTELKTRIAQAEADQEARRELMREALGL